ncbi:FAST kinase domain-containing protein 4 isoform X2 [Oratosquilla oratoria]|uniref:FAST kinase domain-containing protein 4 isoform X2 n=1 Tax=Oratosquilla oratoria TaxID=337810 RepID=UPI003F76EAD5
MLRMGRGLYCIGSSPYYVAHRMVLRLLASSVTESPVQVESAGDGVSSPADVKATTASLSVDSAWDLSSLLQHVKERDFDGRRAFQVVNVISKWVQENKITFKDVELEEEYKRLLTLIEKNIAGSSPTTLMTALKNFMVMGVDSNTYVVQSLENELLWNVRKVSVSLLVSIMLLQAQYQDTELQRKVLRETLSTIQLRWVEIRLVRDLHAIYLNVNLFSPDFISKLDDRVIEIAEDMTYEEMSRLFCALGQTKRRVTPVLRSLGFHMAKQADKLNPKQLSNVLFAMNTLNFPDQVLLEKIASDLIPQVSEVDRSSIIGSILVCMGQMKWRNTTLLEVLSEWVEKNADTCRISDMASLILTLACTSYTPNNFESLCKFVLPKLSLEEIGKETVWLDLVWSLVVLNVGTPETIKSVLEPKFVTKLLSSAGYSRMGIKLKLLNINAWAQLLPSYSGPTLDLSEMKDVIVTQSRNELILTKGVQSLLHNFLPPPKYISESVQTWMGVLVDAEFCLDARGNPVVAADVTTKFGEVKESSKPLPEGASRVGLFVWDYKDYTIGTQELTGINKLAVHLVANNNYKVVQIPYTEINLKEKTVKNVQYLQNKLKEELL